MKNQIKEIIHPEEVKAIGFMYFYNISLLTILIFAIVIGFQLRDKLYYYYIGYLVFLLLYGFILLQRTAKPFWNSLYFPSQLAQDLFEPIQFVFIGFYIFFISKLLDVKKYDKLLDRALYILGLAVFIYAISRFIINYFEFALEIRNILFAVVRAIVLPINLLLIFWIIYKVKHPLLPYFIIGQTFFFIGALLASYLGYFGMDNRLGHLLNFREAPNVIFQIGLLLEVYCFSLALSKNFAILRKEKEKAASELIAQLQRNDQLHIKMNEDLDRKVNEKTAELVQLYSKLEKEKEQKIKDDFTQRLRETEMVSLRYQMNPHFIFNSLNAIKYTIMTSRNEDAVNYLDDFSSLLRGILQNSHHKKITVEEELEILELYLSLEKNRMGSEFEYTIQVESREELSQYFIPPLLLQPLVENAIWHGLYPSLKQEKKLKIIFDLKKNLQITIEDNGIGRKESAKKMKLHNSIGTNLVKDRLTLFNHRSDQNIRINIIDLEENGHAAGTRINLTYQ
ncbi:histidine kinase [Aequorivita ciconiae]|uniref:histidine kinase n=1 Tax=Aequorivita ciconiae TaxID=2494375 RepID=UPI001F0BAAC3|nr:histidine kinase [Aequorivita sp. H23M31]